MAKTKMSKKSTSIDMTAMCDVAFLLLTFFILTATAKVPEPITIDTPNSTNKHKLPDNNLVMVTVGKGGAGENVFFDIKGRELRVKALELMGTEYGVTFSDKEAEQFSIMESFGVPIQNLKEIINMNSSERNRAGLQPGIPFTDSIGNANQLKKWIYTARQANIELTGGTGDELHFAIKGDSKLQYPKIKKIMDIFQDQKINTFDLVTGLRGKDF